MNQICLMSLDKSEKWELEQREFHYLYSYLLRFINKYNLIFFENSFVLEGDLLLIFRMYLLDSLNDLINDLYEKPPEKSISKHPTRYERFNFNNTKYIVDYTTSIKGRLIYTIYLRTVFLTEKIEKGESVLLVYKSDEEIGW